ncbi:MAG: ABC transporter permease [Nocardioidaceae bacterium]
MTGLMTFGSEGGSAGATIVVFSSEAMQELFHRRQERLLRHLARPPRTVSPRSELRDAATRLLPGRVRRKDRRRRGAGERGRDPARSSVSSTRSCWCSPVSRSVVGTFLIVNTFSILVAQRSRELALLRALGASTRQVNRSVLVEAFAVGTVRLDTRYRGRATCWRLACRALFGLFGLDLADADFPVDLRTVARLVRRRPGRDDGRRLPTGQARQPDRAGGGHARRGRAAGVVAATAG